MFRMESDDDDDLLDVIESSHDDAPLLLSGLVCQGSQLYQIDSQLESLDYENQQSVIRKVDLANSEKSDRYEYF